MPDKTLTMIVYVVIALSAAHDLDHLLRDDFSESSAKTIAAAFLTVKYALTGVLLWAYLRARVGAATLAVIGALGAALLWFAHLSPGAEQKPADIYAMYANPTAGLAASGVVYALMLALLALAFYGGWRIAVGLRRP